LNTSEMFLLEKEMLDNILYYYQNQQKLKETYAGKFIVINDKTVLGSFGTWQDASVNALKLLQQDNFFVKYCG